MPMVVNAKWQVTLPKAVRDAVGIKPGDRVELSVTASGKILVQKPSGRGDDLGDRTEDQRKKSDFAG